MTLSPWLFSLDAPDPAVIVRSLAGGKGVNLAQLRRAGLPVPAGWILTTDAYTHFVHTHQLQEAIQAALAPVDLTQPATLAAASDAIRQAFAACHLPAELTAALEQVWQAAGRPLAVRSSATAEDLPDLSFAGQQDTFLNVIGPQALQQAVLACWSSLWTARAIGYRARNHIPQAAVRLAVVIQHLLPAVASGVLFTADPLTGRRTHMVVDATLGLGEALVAGQVEPDHYLLDGATGAVLEQRLGAKATVTRPAAAGGLVVERGQDNPQAAISPAILRQLAALGRQAASLFGAPQDVEWVWDGQQVWLVQARAITSLYPLPAGLGSSSRLVVLASLGAVQGMLDPITSLGQDGLKLLLNGGGRLFGYRLTLADQHLLYTAGERLFVNITPAVTHPLGRRIIRSVMPQVEPSIVQAITAIWDDPRLAPAAGRPWRGLGRAVRGLGPILPRLVATWARPDAARRRAVAWQEEMLTTAAETMARLTTLAERWQLGQQLLTQAIPRILPRLLPFVAGGIGALKALDWLAQGVPQAQERVLLTMRGLPHNVTTEMDLSLWQLAQRLQGETRLRDQLLHTPAADLAQAYQAGTLPPPAQQAIAAFLARYGMRGPGEIDIGRPRWLEDLTPVMQLLHSYLQIDRPQQAPDVIFHQGAAAAESALAGLIHDIRRRPWGWLKAPVARLAARRIRALAGLRESPKFIIIRLMGVVRAALLTSGATLVAQGVLDAADDLFYLSAAELEALGRGEQEDWRGRVQARREAAQREAGRRQIPRLLLSDGHAFYEGVRRDGVGDVPGALTGAPVSPGVAEGVVHVVLDPAGVHLTPGEILVCPGTDPAWTPLFLAASALVMEVGGLMTHGSVVAREYGIPAVVGVHQATTRLQTGQRIRVDGSAGLITLLSP